MTIGWWYLAVALIGLGLVANAAWPRRGPILIVPSWLAALLTVDLPAQQIGLAVLVSAGFVAAGALQTVPGQLALATTVVSCLGLVVLWRPAFAASATIDQVADALALDTVAPLERSLLATPFRRRLRGVEVTRDVVFFEPDGDDLRLDVYRSAAGGDPRPALVYLHGGAWMFGDKKSQGLPLCNHLASLGWACFNANYRLSPAATWPDHLVDGLAAVAWVREHAGDYGVDPGFIAVAGGSSGAHIAAMGALTTTPSVLSGDLEGRDASVQAVVTSYGLYDLTNRLNAHNPQFFSKLVGPKVLKASPATEPDRFSAASPRDHVARARVPWLIIHGEDDTLAPVVEARDFANALERHGAAPTGYAEIPSAVHGFDVWYSQRAIAAVELTARFLTTMARRAKASGPTEG